MDYYVKGQPPCATMVSSIAFTRRRVLGKRSDDALIMAEIVVGECAPLAVFEPFCADLVAAYKGLPCFRRDPLEVLILVDPYASRCAVHARLWKCVNSRRASK